MRKFRNIVLYTLFLLVLAEVGIGYLGFRLTQGEAFDYRALKMERLEIINVFKAQDRVAQKLGGNQSKKQGSRPSTEILHPYIGYVKDYRDEECPQIGFCDDRMREYRKLTDGLPFPARTADRALVMITGGSFAHGVSRGSSLGKLEEALARIPALKGKEILIYTLAIGGFKQPQQLMALQYYMALGAEFDMVINIDGFNEIVLPQAENIPFGTNPYFPRIWHKRVRRGGEIRQDKALEGLAAYVEQQRARLAEATNASRLRHSALKNLFWKFRDKGLQNRVALAKADYLNNTEYGIQASAKRLVVAGTPFPREDRALAVQQIAEFWRRSSVQMHDTLAAKGVPYYHFLQPNQYVEGSKPMGEEERRAAFLEGTGKTHPYAGPAKLGYPALMREGEKLSESDVRFKDLTPMFKDQDEILYRDACCHLNTQGYDYIVDEVVNSIIADQF